MVSNIPKFIVIKPAIYKTYVCYETETEYGHVYCKGESVFNPYTKIELEQAKAIRRYYHLRFCQSNRYWAKCKFDTGIVAVSKQPDEETDKSSCTLFEPLINDRGVLRLFHVQSGKSVLTDSSGLLCLEDNGKDHDSKSYAFTYVDWDELVTMPKRVMFKGDNGMFLGSVVYDYHDFLQFCRLDSNDGYADQEVSQQPDGHVRIKSKVCSKYWRRSPNWIWTDSSDESGDDVDTLFWPVKVDSQTIALRNAGNGKFVKRLTTDGKTDCLNAADAGISRFAKLFVEQHVSESEVYNVRYRMEDARVFDEQPYVAGVGTAINESDTEDSLTVKVSKEVTDTYSFTHSYSLKTGGKVTVAAGIPLVVEGKIDASFEVSATIGWGTTQTDKRSVEASFTVKVPPKSAAKVSYVGTRGKCSVPFSYMQKDKNARIGTFVTSYHNDGVFYGTNYYSFSFQHPAVEPL